MRYKKEHEIAEVVRTFEDATISRDAWKHAEHLTVALFYLCNDDIGNATEKMRKGLFKLLGSFGVDLTKEMPYHETLTIFWMRTVSDFHASKNGGSRSIKPMNSSPHMTKITRSGFTAASFCFRTRRGYGL